VEKIRFVLKRISPPRRVFKNYPCFSQQLIYKITAAEIGRATFSLSFENDDVCEQKQNDPFACVASAQFSHFHANPAAI
jgi:hypothetical protein